MTREHKVRAGTYVPDVGVEYPKIPDEPMLHSKKLRDIKFDASYPYWDRSFKGRLWSVLIYAVIFTLVFFLHPLKYGLKIKGRENLRPYWKRFKNGAMTISNHVYRWDFLAVVQAVRWRRIWFPAKKENIEGSDGAMIRGAGGVPIPDTPSAMREFNKALDDLHARRKWLHVFPESCRWAYYEPIRPFKKGAFSIAHRLRLPIIPMAFSYRPARGLLKLFTGGKPCVTLNVGTPLFFDESLSPREAARKMLLDCHAAVVSLAGIEQNGWDAEEPGQKES